MRQEPVLVRRLVFLLLCLAIALGLLWLAVAVLAGGGWTIWEVLILIGILGNLPWLAISAGNGLIGLAILLLAKRPAAYVTPQLDAAAPPPPKGLTAIAVCIRNEDMAAVIPPLARLLDGLEAAGCGDRFVLWFLSDTQDPAHAAAEDAALAAFAASRAGRPIAVRWRRRADNTGFKAGNVMEFLENHAGEAEFFLCLDADSEMTATAVLRLVTAMEADPKLAILQQLIVGRPASAAFPRLFQFGMRAAMRAWATGQAWWQADEGPYWGHNALIRIAPFRAHCKLERLPDGSMILSHDQVEAVRLHAAGWKVRCLPEEDGSMEGNPPAMPEFLRRDQRWAAGNMQYFALLRLPGMTAMGRWQLLQAILLFFGAPLWLLVLLAALLNVLTGGAEGTPIGLTILLLLLAQAAYVGSKLPGYAEVLLKPTLAARYGGRAHFAKGAGLEMLFTQLFEPVRVLNQAMFLLLLAFGVKAGWAPQNRADRGVPWADAARLLWPHTLVGVVITGLAFSASWVAGLLMLPWTLSMVLCIPFCVATSSPRVSAWLRQRKLCATPEELAAA
jgi:membrane glycosyltransferase